MKSSQLFTKTFRNDPKDETALSAKLLMRAGYIHKELAGVYDFLPLGFRVLENIKTVIRKEMNAIGGQEIQMSALQSSSSWEMTGRWSDDVIDVWFKTVLNAGGELGLATTHEEPITAMLKNHIHSYKDLPVYVYQFQNKFRNELRSKSGILRTREFLMKDLYSFCLDRASHEAFYAEVEKAYKKIYANLGIGDYTHETFASGGSFSKYSHEFQTITPVGEDIVWHTSDFSVVLNEEVLKDDVLADLGVAREDLTSSPASEVGNIFTLGLKYSEGIGLTYADKDDKDTPVFMGSYGIGVSRVLGIIAEMFADDKGLSWPEHIAPYRYYLIGIGEAGTAKALELHNKYPELILLDDRDIHPGEKFADADLLGIPYRVVISDKTLEKKSLEITARRDGKESILTIDKFQAKLSSIDK